MDMTPRDEEELPQRGNEETEESCKHKRELLASYYKLKVSCKYLKAESKLKPTLLNLILILMLE